MKDKCTYIGYRSDAAAARRLKEKYGADSALEFLLAIAEYGLDQHLPTFVNPSAEDAFYFADIQRRVDADVEKYATTVEKRKEAGRKGGIASGDARSKTKQNEANEANEANASIVKQNEANEAVSVSVSVSESVPVSVSVPESEYNSLSLSHTREGDNAQGIAKNNTTSPLYSPQEESQRQMGGTAMGAVPTLEQVVEYAKMIGCPDYLARKFYNHYEANGWVTDGENPRPFKWQNKLAEWKVAEGAKARTRHADISSNKQQTNKLKVNDEYNDL